MTKHNEDPQSHISKHIAARIAITYAVIGFAYIGLSDRILATIVPPEQLTALQTVKGWIFIVVTALLVHHMVRSYAAAMESSRLKLQQSERSYRGIVETANEGIALVDSAGSLLLVNARLAEMLGYSPREMTGESLLSFLSDEGRILLAEKLDPRSPSAARGCDIKLATKGGEEVWAIAAVSPLYQDECYNGSLVMFTDISDHKRLEAQLSHLQKMEAIGQLAGGVAHDFNNIVTAILGNVDLMRRQMKRQPVPLDQLAADVDQVEQATERAMALTRQLLTFSRRQPVEPEVVQPARLLGDIEKMLRRLIREDIDLRIVVAPDVAMVRVDTGQLEQVIVNLAVNARDAMPSGGKLTIEAFNVELDADYVASHAGAAAGPHVVFAVSDTGTGIETKVLPRIFEPFFTTKPKDQGTGLGLATVYGIAKRFDGHVTVYTEMGIGTTFKVYLPRSAGQAGRAASGVQAVPVAGGTETLLVCEDDETIRQLMCRVLTERGYQVLSAENSQKGIELAARHEGPIDLLVTDVIMQGMSGGQMAQQLKAQRPNMRILYVSGYTSDVVEQHGVLESGIQFLQKPFTAEDLARRVRELLDSEKI